MLCEVRIVVIMCVLVCVCVDVVLFVCFVFVVVVVFLFCLLLLLLFWGGWGGLFFIFLWNVLWRHSIIKIKSVWCGQKNTHKA